MQMCIVGDFSNGDEIIKNCVSWDLSGGITTLSAKFPFLTWFAQRYIRTVVISSPLATLLDAQLSRCLKPGSSVL